MYHETKTGEPYHLQYSTLSEFAEGLYAIKGVLSFETKSTVMNVFFFNITDVTAMTFNKSLLEINITQ